MKKILLGVLGLFLILLLVIFLNIKFNQKPKVVHFHAGFQVYKNDILVDFSKLDFMHEKPCTINGKPLPGDHDSDQEEKAHLHDLVGDVVHVHRAGATWGDLFTNIKYLVPADNTAYVNGKHIDHILTTPIHAYDSMVLFVGKHTDDSKYLKNAVRINHIKEIEKRSESCSS